MNQFEQLFESFASQKIGVIGDLMLDTYIWGKTDRISPEAPVPVVTLDHKEFRIGGAGNVALNCRSLGATVSVLSVTGNDEDGNTLDQLLRDHEVDTSFLIQTKERITTNKTRIISRNQHMMRLDAETIQDITSQLEEQLLAKVESFIQTKQPDIIIFEDYNKGVLTPRVIQETIRMCNEAGIITSVDPKRKNFFRYKGVIIFKPNLKEVKEGLNLLFDDVDIERLKAIHSSLAKELQHQISFITLSEKGVFYQQEDKAGIISSHLRNIADVSGAGDTVIAVASMVYAATRNVKLMADLANIAGGLVCEEVGTVAIDRRRLLQECALLLP